MVIDCSSMMFIDCVGTTTIQQVHQLLSSVPPCTSVCMFIICLVLFHLVRLYVCLSSAEFCSTLYVCMYVYQLLSSVPPCTSVCMFIICSTLYVCMFRTDFTDIWTCLRFFFSFQFFSLSVIVISFLFSFSDLRLLSLP